MQLKMQTINGTAVVVMNIFFICKSLGVSG